MENIQQVVLAIFGSEYREKSFLMQLCGTCALSDFKFCVAIGEYCDLNVFHRQVQTRRPNNCCYKISFGCSRILNFKIDENHYSWYFVILALSVIGFKAQYKIIISLIYLYSWIELLVRKWVVLIFGFDFGGLISETILFFAFCILGLYVIQYKEHNLWCFRENFCTCKNLSKGFWWNISNQTNPWNSKIWVFSILNYHINVITKFLFFRRFRDLW